MRLSSWAYNIKQGLKNIARNRMFSLASIATMTTCLFLLGIFFALTINFNYIVEQTEQSICITVFFEEDTSKNEIKAIGDLIKKREEVYYIKYTSPEEAWEKWQKEHFKGYEELIEGFRDDNPLANSASYEIYLNDITKQETMVAYLKTIEGIRSVNSSKAAAQMLEQVSTVVSGISLGLVGILLFVAVFLISNTITIGVTVRKEELSIMKLIGATDLFVKSPFLVEGVMIGLIGSVIPLVIVYNVYDYALNYLLDKNSIIMGTIKLVPVGEIFRILVPAILIIGIGIGFLGSYFTINKHIKNV